MPNMSVAGAYRRFNPRAREGRDGDYGKSGEAEMYVSIHAPARGATTVSRRSPQKTQVSIHAPARGATVLFFSTENAKTSFQSTRPRGARRFVVEQVFIEDLFQSTRPRGARRMGSVRAAFIGQFQSTRPRGARRGDHAYKVRQNRRFNPRAREGRDRRQVNRRLADRMVSIHAPARGATRRASRVFPATSFQSTRPRGARPAAG